jgi:hypothetical protein
LGLCITIILAVFVLNGDVVMLMPDLEGPSQQVVESALMGSAWRVLARLEGQNRGVLKLGHQQGSLGSVAGRQLELLEALPHGNMTQNGHRQIAPIQIPNLQKC